MMLTVDGSFNSPCYGMEASASYDYFSVSSTALCASCSPCSNGQMFDDLFTNNRTKMWASRLIQLCDAFDQEFFQPSSSTSSWASFIWRFFI
ncbi:hypothetical protein OSTOST_18973 [Ostertagia ostertagi]